MKIHRKKSTLSKYNALLKYMDKYEKELEEKRKIIHDFRNQIIVINGYTSKNNTKLKHYLNEIIKEQNNIHNCRLITGVEKLPKGIKGLIYYKFLNIYENINLSILINNSLNKYNKISSKNNKEILQIIGILIDNSIEAIEATKDKIINIDFTMKKEVLFVQIVNSTKTNIKIEIKEIIKPGFSTKGKKRGYGLNIVQEIVNNNENMSIDFHLIDNMFYANLTIKIDT